MPGKRRGPRPTGGTPDRKSTISVRIPPALKEMLFAATIANDRPLSQEAELRLYRSFDAPGDDETQLGALSKLLLRMMRNTIAMSGALPEGNWMASDRALAAVELNVAGVLAVLRGHEPPAGADVRLLLAIGDPTSPWQWATMMRAELGPDASRRFTELHERDLAAREKRSAEIEEAQRPDFDAWRKTQGLENAIEMFVKPAPGLKVRKPDLQLLEQEGERVAIDVFWWRRIRDGDVILDRGQDAAADDRSDAAATSRLKRTRRQTDVPAKPDAKRGRRIAR